MESSICNKPIFIINGSAGVGKDAFVKACGLFTVVMNYSSVDKVKQIAEMIGWNGSKDEKSRKLLSDLKVLTTQYNDMPFRDMQVMVDYYRNKSHCKVMFLHIREPKEIKRAVQEFKAKSVLVIRDSVKHITSNMADANVFDYDYDFTIHNNESLDALRSKAEGFLIEQGII